MIVEDQPLGMKSPAGTDVHGLVLTILCDGDAPHQARVASPVPESRVPLLDPGSKVPAKVILDSVAIDWDAAVTAATHAQ